MTSPLIELQAADTMVDQLRHRRENMGERDQLQSARNDLIRWDQSRQTMRRRLDELSAEIERAEQASRSLDDKKTKLQAQLRQVIAPREAEALQHEIANLDRERSELDDVELAALEEQSRIDDDLSALLTQEPTLRETFLAADAVLSTAEADIDTEIERTTNRIEELRKAVGPKVLRRYDRLREHHLVAAATLSGSRCEGCHLDLSAHEIDDVREAAAANEGITECPQCGRLLVI